MTKFLAFVGLLAIFGAIVAAIFFFGGHYNVAGTAGEPEFVKWALSHVRDASIEHHAKDDPPLSLDDPAIVQAGARAFSERGCVNCHGGPGVNWAKFSEGLRPEPADLKELANDRPQELFWVIKNGINMTGMPSRICLSNNAAERELRGIALGRKSWLFAGSDRGGVRAAVMLTLIQTARLNDVIPKPGSPTCWPGSPITR